MPRRIRFATWAALAAAVGLSGPPSPHAFKTTNTPSPGASGGLALRNARLLARQGEPRLAVQALATTNDPGLFQDELLVARLLFTTGRPAAAESLLALGDARLDENREFRNRVHRARLLLEAGQYESALSCLAPIEGVEDPLYESYRDYVAARSLLAGGEPDGAARALEKARSRAPEALRPAIDGARIEIYRAQGRREEAFAASGDACESARHPADVRRWLLIRFDLAVEVGDDAAAVEAARRLFDGYGRSVEAEACAADVVARGVAQRSSSEFLLASAGVLQARGRGEPLHAVLRLLDARELSASQGEAHRLLWGEYHYLEGDFSRAIALARPGYADPALRRRSMLLMARSYKRVGRLADAATMYEGFAEAFPNDNLAAEALYSAASLYQRLNRGADRSRVLDELRHAYPSTFHGWAASMARARMLKQSGAYADAAAILEQWLTRSRRTDEAALFYLARLERDAGNPEGAARLMDELRAVNPYSFYVRPDVPALMPAMAPAAKEAGPLIEWIADAGARREGAYERVLAVARATERAGEASDAEAARAALERGRFFLAAGLRDWAEDELDVARARGEQSAAASLALARLYEEYAMPWRSVRLYEQARAGIPWSARRAYTDDFRYLTHPLPYPAQVLDAAARETIAPHLLYGMMREESRFDAEAVSRAGAVGLMQLMPETARLVARKMDRALDVDEQLGDPEVNVSLGAWYASDLLRAGEGSAAWMLAAYNAGPGAAGRWIRPGSAGDAAVDAVEGIDYKETRGYVKRVVESANIYHDLYFADGENASGSPR